MSAHLLLATLATVPATTLVAVGVLGVLSAGLRRRSAPSKAMRSPSPGSIAARSDTTAPHAPDEDDALDDSPRAAAHRSLEVWAGRPRAEWRALGELDGCCDQNAMRAREVAELILDGVIAHRAEPFDAWLVRDLAQTAWQMAPDDGTVMSPKVEAAARRVVEHAALALLVRDWLPVEDLALLVGAVQA
jgi:hypothetical protein